MMADAWTRRKLELQDRVMHDARLTPAARLVFYEILQHVNRKSGDAWPSEKRLADNLGLEERTVRRAIHGDPRPRKTGNEAGAPGLIALGYITVEMDGRCNTYRPIFGDRPEAPDSGPMVRNARVGDTGPKCTDSGPMVRPTPDQNVSLTLLRNPEGLSLPAHRQAKPGGTTALRLSEEEPEPNFGLVFEASGRAGEWGPAFATWERLERADRIAVGRLIARDGAIDTAGAWLMTWLRARAWEQTSPKLLEDEFETLAPGTAEWDAERLARLARGDPVDLMDERARSGRPMTIRKSRADGGMTVRPLRPP